MRKWEGKATLQEENYRLYVHFYCFCEALWSISASWTTASFSELIGMACLIFACVMGEHVIYEELLYTAKHMPQIVANFKRWNAKFGGLMVFVKKSATFTL